MATSISATPNAKKTTCVCAAETEEQLRDFLRASRGLRYAYKGQLERKAPMAMRIPISLVRLAAMYDINP